MPGFHQPTPALSCSAIWFVCTRTISHLTGDIARGRASRSSRFQCAIPPIEQGIERSRVLVWASLRPRLTIVGVVIEGCKPRKTAPGVSA